MRCLCPQCAEESFVGMRVVTTVAVSLARLIISLEFESGSSILF